MNKPAAFTATYSDWKLIRSRKVVQIVFEVPVEAADAAYQVVGGMPNAGEEAWFAIARLTDGGGSSRHAPREGQGRPDMIPAPPASHQECIWPDCRIKAAGQYHCEHSYPTKSCETARLSVTQYTASPGGAGQEARAEDASGSAAPLCPDAGPPSPAGLATGFGERPPTRRSFTALALPAQAAMLCQDAVFRVYVVETWADVDGCRNEDEAQAAMYARYNITSRRELQHNTRSGQRFMHDRDQFLAWKALAP